jgi:ABC-type nickel/cobalt efflux system permease component RcnA
MSRSNDREPLLNPEEQPPKMSFATKHPYVALFIGISVLPVGLYYLVRRSGDQSKMRQHEERKVLKENAGTSPNAHNPAAQNNPGPVPMQPGAPGHGTGHNQVHGSNQGHGTGQSHGQNTKKTKDDDLKKSWFTRHPKITTGLCFALCFSVIGIPIAMGIAAYSSHRHFKEKREKQKMANQLKSSDNDQVSTGHAQVHNPHQNSGAQVGVANHPPAVNQNANGIRNHLNGAVPVQPPPPSAGAGRRQPPNVKVSTSRA